MTTRARRVAPVVPLPVPRKRAVAPAPTPREILDAQMDESAFVGQIIEYATLRGWLFDIKRQDRSAAHVPKGVRKADRDAAGDGMPDLILTRASDGRLIFFEVKRAGKGTALREKQVRWGEALMAVAAQSFNVAYRVVEPKDWTLIERLLR
jgi:hypothetical protein